MSWSWHNKGLQTGRLQMTNYPLRVLKAGSPKARCPQGHAASQGLGKTFLSLLRLLVAPGIPITPLRVASFSVSLPAVSLLRTLELDSSTTSIIQDDLISRALIISAKTLSPNKAIFRGSRAWGVAIFWGELPAYPLQGWDYSSCKQMQREQSGPGGRHAKKAVNETRVTGCSSIVSPACPLQTCRCQQGQRKAAESIR